MKKNLTLILIAVISIALVYALIKYLKMDTFGFAWALNFLLMGCVVFFTEALKSPLSSPYFDQKPWERKGEIYEQLGINAFRKLLVLIGWEKIIRKGNPIEKNTKALANLYYITKKSEFDHLIIFFIILGFNIFVCIKFGFVKSLSLLILNVILHVYPIMLQRYNRPRMARALALSRLK